MAAGRCGSVAASARIWFVVAIAGQWLFVYYIAGFYAAYLAFPSSFSR